MALDMPNDRALFNVIAIYEREIPGNPLTGTQLIRVTEAAKRMVIDELHSVKSTK